jgi:uncharacterized membrane protein (UPF0182 family)
VTQANLRPQRKASPFSIAVGIIAVIAVALLSAAGVFTDLLWFRQLGFETIFVTEIVAQIVTFLIGWLVMTVLVGIGLAFGSNLSQVMGKCLGPLHVSEIDMLNGGGGKS